MCSRSDRGDEVKAHQRIIREQRAAKSADADLFGNWWENIDIDIGRAIVKEIDIATAKSLILKYEWLGSMPAVVWHCYGIYFNGHLGGAVVYGPEYSENLGVWDKYGFTGRMILLSRGACVHWAHPHSASKLIRNSIRALPRRFDVVTATVDRAAGELGTIYQACNFVFAPMNTHTRSGMISAGKTITSRQMRQRFGKANKATANKFGCPVIEHPKGRYFTFRGPPSIRRKHLRAISHLIKPYTKRDPSRGRARANSCEAGATPAGRSSFTVNTQRREP